MRLVRLHGSVANMKSSIAGQYGVAANDVDFVVPEPDLCAAAASCDDSSCTTAAVEMIASHTAAGCPENSGTELPSCILTCVSLYLSQYGLTYEGVVSSGRRLQAVATNQQEFVYTVTASEDISDTSASG